RIARRHKVESRWRCSLEIITKRLVFRKRLPTRRFVPPFASWRANIILMWRRIKRQPKKNLRRSTRHTRYWATPRSEKDTINSALIGIGRADSKRHQAGSGKHSSRALNFINGAAMAVGCNLNSVEPDSAISSRHFLAVAAAG